MQTIEVELEDGQRYQIQVPDEASEAEVLAHIEQLKVAVEPEPDVTEGMSGLERFTAGVGRGVSNVGRQLGNMLGIVPDETLAEYRALDEPLLRTGAGQAGSFVGELAATAPVAGGAVGLGARMIPGAARFAATPIRAGAARGAAEGALEGMVLAGPENRMEGALWGAGAGSVGGAALPFLARGFRQADEGSQVLRDMGVELTPGLMVPTGAWNQIEEAAQSWPFVGASVRSSRQRPMEQFTKGMIQEGRPPGTAPVTTGEPEEMLNAVYAQYAPAYDQFKGYRVSENSVEQLEDSFLNAAFDPGQAIDASVRNNIFDYLTGKLSGLENRAVTTDDLLKIRSDLRKQIAKKKKQQQWDHADLLENAERGLTDIINDALPADKQALMPQVDAQYGKHKIAEDALYSAGDRGMPTPFQWQQAVKKAQANRGAYARGAGTLREPVKAAREAFQQVSPATGQRLATLGGIGAIAGGALGLNDPAAAFYLGMPLALLAGSRTGRQFSVGATDPQAWMRRVLESTATPAPLIRGMLPVYTQEE